MKTIKSIFAMFVFALFVAGPFVAVAAPTTTLAASTPGECERRILGIPTWFRGLASVDGNGNCGIVSPGQPLPDGSTLDLSGFIWRIALNLIEIALFIVGYIAVFFVIYGGFQFLTGGSKPEQIEKARKTILNAVIGLAISIGAVAITNLIFRILN